MEDSGRLESRVKKTFRFERAGKLYEVSIELDGKSVVMRGRVMHSGDSWEIGDVTATVDAVNGAYMVSMNGSCWTGAAARVGKDVYVCGAGRTAILTLAPEGQAVKTGVKSFEPVLKAPITGKIVKVLHKAGVKIPAGGVIVVMDAMKMEFQLKATHDSILRKLLVAPGQLVELGQPIAELERLK